MRNVGDDLIQGMENALAHVRGKKPAARETVVPVQIPDAIDVKAIRSTLGMTQERFALQYGFSITNIRNWEQGYRQPEGSARAYLTVISRMPKQVESALRSAPRRKAHRAAAPEAAYAMAATAPRD